jgi:hypothetical protein
MMAVVSRWLLGHPLATAQAVHARLTKTVALAVCSSDALSSVVIAKECSLAMAASQPIAHQERSHEVFEKKHDWSARWCPSIAWMKYAQRAPARYQLLMHGIRSTSGLRYELRHQPLPSGDGVLRCVRQEAEIPSRDAGPGSRSFDSRSLSAVRVLDHPCSGSPARLPW